MAILLYLLAAYGNHYSNTSAPLSTPTPTPAVAFLPGPTLTPKRHPDDKVQTLNTQSNQIIDQVPLVAVTHSPALIFITPTPTKAFYTEPTLAPKPTHPLKPQPTYQPEPEPTQKPEPLPTLQVTFKPLPIPLPSCPAWPVKDKLPDETKTTDPLLCLDSL